MSYSNRKVIVALAAMVLSGFAVGRDITRDEAQALMDECEEQRAEKIAPLREEAIEDCVDKGRGDREYCERFNRTFGNARARPGGGVIPGLFWGLPVCEQAVEAERFFRMNPGRDVYSLP